MSKVIALKNWTNGPKPPNGDDNAPLRIMRSDAENGPRLVLPLQVYEDGRYAGGYPIFIHRIFSRFCANPHISMDKELEHLQASTPYTFQIEEVSFHPHDSKIRFLHKNPHHKRHRDTSGGTWVEKLITPQDLAKKWLPVVRGIADISATDIKDELVDAIQVSEELLDKISFAAACNDGVKEEDFPTYLESVRESFLCDINRAFLENYQDYQQAPDHSRRTFEYYGLHI